MKSDLDQLEVEGIVLYTPSDKLSKSTIFLTLNIKLIDLSEKSDLNPYEMECTVPKTYRNL